ncbi:YjjG family noncanonical pyrimidine nucleotidase [bacterium]|nr:YjjG family noncanonical pyrimidine nucleotidase [bacterium]
MKKYRNLLFDVDDTLLDFGAAERLALRLLFEEHAFPFTPETEAAYRRINQELWHSFERGVITRDEVLHSRHSRLFLEFGREVDGAELDRSFSRHLEAGNQLVNGALELIVDLQADYHLYLVTNGVSHIQDKRLRGSGLHPLFKGIFVSEDTGYHKPMKQYFDYVFARIPGFSAKETLIIGDSLSADIQGGHGAGLDTCWFNPGAKPNASAVVPTYEIRELDELPRILGAGRPSSQMPIR